MYSSGEEDLMEEFAKGILWLLLMEQSEQESLLVEATVTGRENFEIKVFKIEDEG